MVPTGNNAVWLRGNGLSALFETQTVGEQPRCGKLQRSPQLSEICTSTALSGLRDSIVIATRRLR